VSSFSSANILRRERESKVEKEIEGEERGYRWRSALRDEGAEAGRGGGPPEREKIKRTKREEAEGMR
jgi:hypothetical protein